MLAVTVKETKPVDEVVLVPVFKHPVKTDLLPFEDRVAMCRMAVQGKGVGVSTVERETGESNVAMLRALRAHYPAGTQILWVCGDDVFDWIDNPKGQAMMRELNGVIVQRRLHQAIGAGGDSFYKSPMDTAKVATLEKSNLKVHLIFGELPHFSSTLVRSSPASWRAYLPQCVGAYLDKRPHLIAQLVRSSGREVAGGEPALSTSEHTDDVEATEGPLPPPGKRRRADWAAGPEGAAELQERVTSCVMQGLAVVHAIQRERGRTALALALRDGQAAAALRLARAELDHVLRDVPCLPVEAGEAHNMAQELVYTPTWLARDRQLLDQYLGETAGKQLEEEEAGDWLHRAALLRKFNSRVDVLIDLCTQVLGTQVAAVTQSPVCDRESGPESMLRLFRLWSRGKEALGRERAFVCAAGRRAREHVRGSLRARARLGEVVELKEIMLRRIFSEDTDRAEAASRGPCAAGSPWVSRTSEGLAAGEVDALHKILAHVTAWEWSLMRCFSASTPLRVLHQALANEEVPGLIPAAGGKGAAFDVNGWFDTTSSAVDLMLTLVQGLAAGICASKAAAFGS